MTAATGIVDVYVLKARVFPGLLFAFPAAVTSIALAPSFADTGKMLLAIFAGAGGLFLLSHIVRDLGKRKEQMLYAGWGGSPTTRQLRHRDSSSAEALARLHDEIQSVIIGFEPPSAEHERQHPTETDELYERAVVELRERTRDTFRFRLLWAANIDYGFRRNLWALKSAGIVVCIASLGFLWLPHVGDLGSTRFAADPFLVSASAIDVGMLLVWVFVVSKSWVKTASEEYATRLLACVAVLRSENSE